MTTFAAASTAFTAFSALVRKDLKLFVSNRRAVLISIVAPILIAAFFGSVFGHGDTKPAHIPVGVSDLDRSVLSGELVAALKADPALAVVELEAAAGADQVRSGTLRAAIVLPAGFGAAAGRALFGGSRSPKPEIVLSYDPSQAMVLPLVRGLLAQHAFESIGRGLTRPDGPMLGDLRRQVESASGMPAERRAALVAMFDSIDRATGGPAGPGASAAGTPGTGLAMPFTTRETEAGAGPEAHYDGYAHAFAGMGVQFILLMGVDAAIGLLTMRRLGLWKRLRAAPLSRATLLGSRLASTALIALGVFAVVYGVAGAVFGVRIRGSLPGFLLVLLAFAALTASFGLLIAAIGRTPEATRGLAILATLLMVMLGGAWVPAFVFPAWLQTASLVVPTRWAIDGLDAMSWRGLGFQAAIAPVAVLLGFSAVFAALAVWRFDWEE